MLVNLYNIAILGIALGMIDLIITKSSIFKPFRVFIDSISGFFGELFQCPVCFSIWLSLAGVWIYPFIAYTNFYFLNFLISWFFLGFIICLSSGAIYRLFKDKS